MKKQLRLSLLVLFTILCGAAYADTVEWDLSQASYSDASENEVTWTNSVATMTAKKGSAQPNANNYLGGDTYSSSRFYKGSTVTLKPATGITIRYVVFTATTDGYATALQNSTWTNATAAAETKTVTVTPTDGSKEFSCTVGATTGHSKVVVYYGDPSGDPGNDPTPEPTAKDYTSIAAILADITATKTDATYTFTDLLVTYVGGQYNFVSDGTNGFLFYGKDLGLTAGDKISGKATGEIYLFNSLPELSVKSLEKTVTSTGNTVPVKTIAASALKDNLNVFVKIENAVYSSASGKSLTFKVDGADVTVFNQFGVATDALAEGGTYILTGIGNIYKQAYQLYLVSFEADPASVNAPTATTPAGPRYNAAGQKVSPQYKGIIIQDGRKVLSK